MYVWAFYFRYIPAIYNLSCKEKLISNYVWNMFYFSQFNHWEVQMFEQIGYRSYYSVFCHLKKLKSKVQFWLLSSCGKPCTWVSFCMEEVFIYKFFKNISTKNEEYITHCEWSVEQNFKLFYDCYKKQSALLILF